MPISIDLPQFGATPVLSECILSILMQRARENHQKIPFIDFNKYVHRGIFPTELFFQDIMQFFGMLINDAVDAFESLAFRIIVG